MGEQTEQKTFPVILEGDLSSPTIANMLIHNSLLSADDAVTIMNPEEGKHRTVDRNNVARILKAERIISSTPRDDAAPEVVNIPVEFRTLLTMQDVGKLMLVRPKDALDAVGNKSPKFSFADVAIILCGPQEEAVGATAPATKARRPRAAKDIIYPSHFETTDAKGNPIKLYGHEIKFLHVLQAAGRPTSVKDLQRMADESNVRFIGYKRASFGATIIGRTPAQLLEKKLIKKVEGRGVYDQKNRGVIRRILSEARAAGADQAAKTQLSLALA